MSLKFDFKDFQTMAKRLKASSDQIPYALAQAMNDGAEVTRKKLIEETWPNAIQSRNKSFIKAALTTAKNRATKKNLRVAIVDKLNRGSLVLHADGGTKKPLGARLAVPDRKILDKRGAKGMRKNLRPRNVVNSFKQGDVIYQRYGKNNSRRELLYTLKPRAKIKKDVPFRKVFERTMRKEVVRAFAPRLRAAMKTRK